MSEQRQLRSFSVGGDPGARVTRPRRLFATMVVLALACLAISTGCQSQARSDDQIVAFDVSAEIRKDGVVHVHESITYDFGPGAGPKTFRRTIPTAKGDLDDLQRRHYDLTTSG